MSAFGGRHGFNESRKFPLENGGSFLDIVQRCWANQETLVQDSLSFIKKLGIIGSEATDDDFMQKYLTMKDQIVEKPGFHDCSPFQSR